MLRMNDCSIKIYEVLDLAPLGLILESPPHYTHTRTHARTHTHTHTHTHFLKLSISEGRGDVFEYRFGVL